MFSTPTCLSLLKSPNKMEILRAKTNSERKKEAERMKTEENWSIEGLTCLVHFE